MRKNYLTQKAFELFGCKALLSAGFFFLKPNTKLPNSKFEGNIFLFEKY